jgi:cell division protein FtsQ
MPAVARKTSKPASRQQQTSGRRAAHRPSTPYTPAKLDAARGLGVAPAVAVSAAALVVAAGLVVALFSGDRLQAMVDGAFAGLGLEVAEVHVQGASPASRDAVLMAAGAHKGDSILTLDLDAMRRRVEHVGWVEDAKVIRLLPDTLVIAVSERQPVAVWQHQGKIGLIDAKGELIKGADPGAFSQLPLVVGEGANEGVEEVLPLLAARPKLLNHTEALVRVDRRRWDLRLKDGGLIQLPALDLDAALIQLDQLDQRARVLALGFAKIDLRDPEMIAVRPRDSQSDYHALLQSSPYAAQAAAPVQSVASPEAAERGPAVL